MRVKRNTVSNQSFRAGCDVECVTVVEEGSVLPVLPIQPRATDVPLLGLDERSDVVSERAGVEVAVLERLRHHRDTAIVHAESVEQVLRRAIPRPDTKVEIDEVPVC